MRTRLSPDTIITLRDSDPGGNLEIGEGQCQGPFIVRYTKIEFVSALVRADFAKVEHSCLLYTNCFDHALITAASINFYNQYTHLFSTS